MAARTLPRSSVVITDPLGSVGTVEVRSLAETGDKDANMDANPVSIHALLLIRPQCAKAATSRLYRCISVTMALTRSIVIITRKLRAASISSGRWYTLALTSREVCCVQSQSRYLPGRLFANILLKQVFATSKCLRCQSMKVWSKTQVLDDGRPTVCSIAFHALKNPQGKISHYTVPGRGEDLSCLLHQSKKENENWNKDILKGLR